MIVAIEPDCGYPLRFTFEPIDFIQQLAVRPLFIGVDNDHIKVVTVHFFHLAGFFDNLFQIIVLREREKITKKSFIKPS